MKRIFLLVAAVFVANITFAQLSTGTNPRSFKDNNITISAQLNIAEPSLDKVMAENEINDTSFYKPRHFGVALSVKEDFFAKAQMFDVSGGKLYVLKIKAPYAQALNIYSDNFYLPKGAELHIYSADRSQVIGAFSSANNHQDKSFASEFIYGDEFYMEYWQPQEVTQKAQIEISKVGYAYRDWQKSIASYGEYGASGSCNVNVNCSEGDNTRNQQRGVMEIVLMLPNNNIGWCTGSLVNNTARDLKGYILTALHCIEDITTNEASYLNQAIFYFKFESSGCTATYKPGVKTLNGCTWVMKGESSDGLLLLLNDSVPASYNAYWNGWNVNTSALTSSGVCIHHPSGDIKKISTYSSTPQTTTLGTYSSGAHIKVYWVQTANGYGITEGGSSGSPLFNANGLIVGTLTGGASGCEVAIVAKYDYYGRMSYHWTSNGTSNTVRLKPWLDPLNLGVTQLAGDDHTTLSSLSDIRNDNTNTILYPMPTDKVLNITVNGVNESIILTLLDMNSRIVMQGKIAKGVENTKLDTSKLPQGVYMLRLATQDNIWVEKVIITR